MCEVNIEDGLSRRDTLVLGSNVHDDANRGQTSASVMSEVGCEEIDLPIQ